MNATPRAVTGRIIFNNTIPAFGNASICITIEDVTIADRPAESIASVLLINIHHHPADANNPTAIPFTINLEGKDPIDIRNFYGVRVRVDILSNGKDIARVLHSNQSYRVLTGGFPDRVDIMF